VLKRSWVILGVAIALLITVGAPSAARADVESDELAWQLLVTSYYMFNAHRVSGPYNDLEYPYADTQGFGLTFAGGDVAYVTDKWGITLNLRWGQQVDRLTEFAPLSRGFVTWIPHEKLTLDMGYFGAFVGIETADEWENATVFTITGTVRYSPVQYLILSLEPRADFADNDIYFSRPFVTDPATGNTVPSLNQDWFFGFWIGATARIGN
jgi:hypothetical protein